GDRPIVCVLGLPHFGQVCALSAGFGIDEDAPTNNAPPQPKPRNPHDQKLLARKFTNAATRTRVQQCAILAQRSSKTVVAARDRCG
ncbi:MAG: hypothetical protein DMF91_04055, partial [Acidobacteria bacterium]